MHLRLLAMYINSVAPSAPPENVQVSAENSRALTLSWQPPGIRSRNGIVQHYYVNITELNTQSGFVVEATGESVVVDDLHPYYQYSCIVAAETVELGPFSAPVTIQLPEDGMKLNVANAFHSLILM